MLPLGLGENMHARHSAKVWFLANIQNWALLLDQEEPQAQAVRH